MSLFTAASISDKINEIVKKLLEEGEKATILVEGNIGAGKSYFLENFFEGRPECTVLYEQVEKMCDFHGENMLQKYHDHPLKYAESFQSLILNITLKQMIRTIPSALKIMERSVFSAFNVFTKNLKENHHLTPVQYNVLDEWYNFSVQMIKTCHLLPEYIIYLRSSPEFCFKQIKKRNRLEEQGISLEYLRQIHKKHEELFYYRKNYKGMHIIVIEVEELQKSEKDEELEIITENEADEEDEEDEEDDELYEPTETKILKKEKPEKRFSRPSDMYTKIHGSVQQFKKCLLDVCDGMEREQMVKILPENINHLENNLMGQYLKHLSSELLDEDGAKT